MLGEREGGIKEGRVDGFGEREMEGGKDVTSASSSCGTYKVIDEGGKMKKAEEGMRQGCQGNMGSGAAFCTSD